MILALLLLWALLSLWPSYVGVVFWHYLCGCKVVYMDNHPSHFVRKRCSSEGCLSDLRLRRLASPVHLMQNTQSKLILTCTFANPQKLLKFKPTRIRAYTVLATWHLWIYCASLPPMHTHVRTSQTQDVTLLHYKQWPEKRRPRSASFLKLFTSAQKLQQPHSDKPILVACKWVA